VISKKVSTEMQLPERGIAFGATCGEGTAEGKFGQLGVEQEGLPFVEYLSRQGDVLRPDRRQQHGNPFAQWPIHDPQRLAKTTAACTC
jgi:hypothetical protein